MTEQQNQQPLDEDEINLLDYLRVIWKRKILIVTIFSIAVLSTLIINLFLPNIYKSTASFLPSADAEESHLSSLSTTLQSVSGVSLPSLTPKRDYILSILKSRLLCERITDQLKLKDYYKCSSLEDAIIHLKKITTISKLNKDDAAIYVTAIDINPQMAADIVNAYVENLDQLMLQFGTGAAGRERRFIAEQLSKIENNLKAAEEALKQFQEKHRTVSLGDQAKGAIDSGTNLKGEIIAEEVQLQVMQNFAKDTHPDVIKIKRRIDELKRQLAMSQYSAGQDLPSITNNPKHYEKEIYLPVVNVPQVALELARFTRNVKLHETLYTLLNQQLEQAKIAEVKDTPTIQILDRAVPTNHRFKPKKKQNILLAGVVSLFLGILIAFLLEYIDKNISVSGKKVSQLPLYRFFTGLR